MLLRLDRAQVEAATFNEIINRDLLKGVKYVGFEVSRHNEKSGVNKYSNEISQ